MFSVVIRKGGWLPGLGRACCKRRAQGALGSKEVSYKKIWWQIHAHPHIFCLFTFMFCFVSFRSWVPWCSPAGRQRCLRKTPAPGARGWVQRRMRCRRPWRWQRRGWSWRWIFPTAPGHRCRWWAGIGSITKPGTPSSSWSSFCRSSSRRKKIQGSTESVVSTHKLEITLVVQFLLLHSYTFFILYIYLLHLSLTIMK